MSEPVSLISNTAPAMIDQDKRPEEQKKFLDKVEKMSFIQHIQAFEQVQQRLIESLPRQLDQAQPSVSDIKTSDVFQEFVKKNNLTEEQGRDLLEKVIKELQELKNIKV
jgi:polyhydroxyalkanoate synthesis regulator phasin